MVADIFPDFNAMDLAAIVTVGEDANTKGADTSVFDWTLSSSSGGLDF